MIFLIVDSSQLLKIREILGVKTIAIIKTLRDRGYIQTSELACLSASSIKLIFEDESQMTKFIMEFS